MRLFKLSLGLEYFDDNKFNELVRLHLVSVHPDTKSKGQTKLSQGEAFIQAQKGDLFFVCRSNRSVEVIGMFDDDRSLVSVIEGHGEGAWLDKSFKLLYQANNPQGYNKNLDKWWSPKNNSTFWSIPPNEFDEFEKDILEPAFGVSMQEMINKRNLEYSKIEFTMDSLIPLQERFKRLFKDEQFLFSEVNLLSEQEIRKQLWSYELRGDVSNQPLVLLRKKLLEEKLKGGGLTTDLINSIKKEIASQFATDVFHSWKMPFRIMYPFLYDQFKGDVISTVNKFIKKIQKELGIERLTDSKLVHFDGAQNQGFDHLWLAIYNKTYSTQKLAMQLFVRVDNGFTYGLYDPSMRKEIDFIQADSFNYNDIKAHLEKYKSVILNDNSMEKAKLSETIELLLYKKQIILQGPPGTGKTYTAKKMVQQITGSDTEEQNKIIQFHPSYTYEDFVRGITAQSNGVGIEYQAVNKILGELAKSAAENPELNYTLIIDEINRANLPSVLGELIYALEYRDEPVDSLYEVDKKKSIIIPSNLYIIGTMNTADRSVGHIDYAIKRRFAFVEMLPNPDVIVNKTPNAKELFDEVATLFVQEKEGRKMNSNYLAPDFDYKDVQLGHSYFILNPDNDENEQLKELRMRLEFEIIPILNEYVKDGLLLETAKPELERILKLV